MNIPKLEVISFGEGKPTLEEAGLSELAIDYDFDRHLIKTMESMRGTLNILPINRNVVMHNPHIVRSPSYHVHFCQSISVITKSKKHLSGLLDFLHVEDSKDKRLFLLLRQWAV